MFGCDAGVGAVRVRGVRSVLRGACDAAGDSGTDFRVDGHGRGVERQAALVPWFGEY